MNNEQKINKIAATMGYIDYCTKTSLITKNLWPEGETLKSLAAKVRAEVLRQIELSNTRKKAKQYSAPAAGRFALMLERKRYALKKSLEHYAALEKELICIEDIFSASLSYCNTREVYQLENDGLLTLNYDETCDWGNGNKQRQYPVSRSVEMYAQIYKHNGSSSARQTFNRRGNWQERLLNKMHIACPSKEQVIAKLASYLPSGFTINKDSDGDYIARGSDKYHFLLKSERLINLAARAVNALNKRHFERKISGIDLKKIWVCVDDSLASGNCQLGTDNFFKQEFPVEKSAGCGALRSDYILSRRDDCFTRRAIRQAILTRYQSVMA